MVWLHGLCAYKNEDSEVKSKRRWSHLNGLLLNGATPLSGGRQVILFKMMVTAAALTLVLFGTDAQADPQNWTILAPEYAISMTHQCSREAPTDFEATWIPTEEHITELEARLSAVEIIQSTACCCPGRSVEGIQSYYRQYVGIVIEGRELIYINAFRQGTETNDWGWEPVVYCDGGDLFWGVLYDPETKEFFGLAFNGEG